MKKALLLCSVVSTLFPAFAMAATCSGDGYQVELNNDAARVVGPGINAIGRREAPSADPEDRNSWPTYSSPQFSLMYQGSQVNLTVYVNGHWTGYDLPCSR